MSTKKHTNKPFNSFTADMSEIIDRLKLATKARNDLQLARIMDVEPPRMISNWRARGTVPFERIIAFCLNNGLDPLVMLGGKQGATGEARDSVYCNYVRQLVNSGEVPERSYVQLDEIWCKTQLGTDRNQLLALIVKDDCMEPTIKHGDLILINMSIKKIASNGVYIIQNDDINIIRRVQKKLDGTLIVQCDNSNYETEILRGEDTELLKIVGKAVWHGGVI